MAQLRPPFKTLISCYRFFFVLSLSYFSPLVNGQAFLNNGQFFTKALAINDSPAPGSPQHAGSNLVIAVELSGNGKIPQSAFAPGSGASTRYDSLELYLVSSQTDSNFTVSNGTGLLTQEPGSTVKHLNWPIPSCVSPGTYNLTYYESSHINNEVRIVNIYTFENPNKNGDASHCNIISNQLQVQPQADSAPTVNPYLDPSSGVAVSSLATGLVRTITLGTSGFPAAWTIEPSGSLVTGATEPITTATIVVVSTATLTETVPGQNSLTTAT
ncbi:hypothetical protein EW145_g6427 [Phellinidium pouzarii]|uniref:Uncharacterized protein n=1 Tax=Phellinidium pouzarii TaxID=167371 RepID=A0A4S4KYG4_9AGAM|nr:hypothetical protein EW145_g6427 [Phellinidium pouzarii]